MFVLLFFADKTHLDNPSLANIAEGSIPTENSAAGQGLPPLAPDEKLDGWIKALESAKESEKLRILDSIVVSLQSRKRYAYASDYALAKVRADSSFQHLLQAGLLSYEATKLDYVRMDSSLFRRYSGRSIGLLRAALEQDSTNEEALLTLGLALVESGVPQNSMQGIMTIRKVLELNPQNVEASFHLGMFSIQTGQFEKAKARFEEVLRLQPTHEQAKYQLAYCLAQLGQRAEAQALLAALIAQSKDKALQAQAQNLMNSLSR